MTRPTRNRHAQLFMVHAVLMACVLVTPCGAWSRALSAEPATASKVLPFEVQLDTVLEHDDGKFLWYHARATPFPKSGGGAPAVLMTLQKHLAVSDHYSGLSVMFSQDAGAHWTDPEPRPELEWQDEGQGVTIAVADVTPGWHAPTRKCLAIGTKVRYSQSGEQLSEVPRSNEAAYAVYDPATGTWTSWKMMAMPETEGKFYLVCPGCTQWLVEADGSILLPLYYRGPTGGVYSATVVRCAFDGETLSYVGQGDDFELPVERGFVEPSLARQAGRYFLTLRNDQRAYVTSSSDGLHYEPVQPWTFDDGSDLGSYNTQAHWLSHSDGLFLIYTRRGANNDHIIRHRAPLFMAQIDPERLCVLRATEKILIPERGGEYGNFGANAVSPGESWVTVNEGVWSADDRKRGAKGALFIARIKWSRPNRQIQESGEPAK